MKYSGCLFWFFIHFYGCLKNRKSRFFRGWVQHMSIHQSSCIFSHPGKKMDSVLSSQILENIPNIFQVISLFAQRTKSCDQNTCYKESQIISVNTWAPTHFILYLPLAGEWIREIIVSSRRYSGRVDHIQHHLVLF